MKSIEGSRTHYWSTGIDSQPALSMPALQLVLGAFLYYKPVHRVCFYQFEQTDNDHSESLVNFTDFNALLGNQVHMQGGHRQA